MGSFLWFCSLLWASNDKPVTIKALYIPLADHYAGVIAYEKYASSFKYSHFQLEKMGNWDLLRAHFLEGDADMAFVMAPLALDMFYAQPNFRWVGLMHRDGNALALNSKFLESIEISEDRKDRKPNKQIAQVFRNTRSHIGLPIEVGVPHILSTHSVVLYSFLKEHGALLTSTPNQPADALIKTVPPPKAPAFIRAKSNRNMAAAFQQSLPWADIVETNHYGKIAWYSKDVIRWPRGHVECIIIVSNSALRDHFDAVLEVVTAIQSAGNDIETARSTMRSNQLDQLIHMIRSHIPEHSDMAIRASLNPNLRVINYQDLEPDIEGLNYIMNLAVEGKILAHPVDIEQFVDQRFVKQLTRKENEQDGRN